MYGRTSNDKHIGLPWIVLHSSHKRLANCTHETICISVSSRYHRSRWCCVTTLPTSAWRDNKKSPTEYAQRHEPEIYHTMTAVDESAAYPNDGHVACSTCLASESWVFHPSIVCRRRDKPEHFCLWTYIAKCVAHVIFAKSCSDGAAMCDCLRVRCSAGRALEPDGRRNVMECDALGRQEI